MDWEQIKWVNILDPSTGAVHRWGSQAGIGDEIVTAAVTDRFGNVWLASLEGGLTRVDSATSRTYRLGAPDGIDIDRLDRFDALMIDSQNTLWVLGIGGVYRSSLRSQETAGLISFAKMFRSRGRHRPFTSRRSTSMVVCGLRAPMAYIDTTRENGRAMTNKMGFGVIPFLRSRRSAIRCGFPTSIQSAYR